MNATVEQWLASGNEVTTLVMGYMAYPDGNIPHSTVNNEEIQKAKQEKIEKEKQEKETAKLLASEEKAKKIQEAKAARELKQKQIRDNKEAKQLAKIEKLAKAKSVSGGKVRVPCDPKEPTPRQKNKAAKMLAIENNESSFTGHCNKHGETVFSIRRNGESRCYECISGLNKNQYKRRKLSESNDNIDRVARNKAKRIEAYAAGKRHFIGECAKCGESEFFIAISAKKFVSCRCVPCLRAVQGRRDRRVSK